MTSYGFDMAVSASDRAILKLNEEFGNDLQTLSKCRQLYDETFKHKTNLEQQLSFASSEVPGQLDSAVVQAEKCTKAIARFADTKEELNGDVSNHAADVTKLSQTLTSLTSQIEELEKYSSYLRCISRVDELSSDIQSALIIGAQDKAVSQYSELANLTQALQESSCENLVSFANDTLLFWYKILKDRFSSEFEEVLSAWRWPFIVTSAKPAKPLPNQNELKEKLPTLFTNLLALRLPSNLNPEPLTKHPVLTGSEMRPLLLPLQLMLKPLSKRFKYHFYGNKQTNSLDKPEWYMTQVITWLRDHREFLLTHIQPLLNKASLPYVDVMVEFSRGLVLLAIDKMHSDVPELLYDDQMFCHFVDESLSFHRELTETFEYPASSQPSCLKVLIQQDAFHKWMLIERKFAMEKMDAMLSDTNAWQSQYSEMGKDIDDLKVPQCGESFITLVLTMTDRYKSIPSPTHKCEFLSLQLEILEEYRVRLAQVKNAEAHSPLSQRYAAILNTVSYVLDVLKDWAELPFFTELQLFRKKSEEDSMYSATEDAAPDEDSALDASQASEVMLPKKVDSSDVDCLDGSVFDQLMDLYDHFRREMLSNLIKYVVDDVKARSHAYRKDKWLALPSQKEYISLGLSTSACEMLMVLKDHLHHIEDMLAKPLFEQAWKQVATDLNVYIYYNVILDNRFNEGGAAQLQFDMTRNLFPLFSQYTHKPENHFKDVKESCLLLTLPTGSAKLLKEVLYQALHDPNVDRKAKVTDPVATLHEMGVYKLALDHCEWVLKLRTDL